MQLTGAIIFINGDLAVPETNDISVPPFAGEANNIATQLIISEIITGQEFDARVAVDPNYPLIVHLNNLRVLVIQDTFQNLNNKHLADLIMFIKQGMATVLYKEGCCPTLSMDIQRLNLNNIFANINRHYKWQCRKDHCGCHCNCFKHLPSQLQQLLIDPYDPSHVHDANCDSIFNNEAFINRK